MTCYICGQRITPGEDVYISYRHKFIGPTDNDLELDLSSLDTLIRHASCDEPRNVNRGEDLEKEVVVRSNALDFFR